MSKSNFSLKPALCRVNTEYFASLLYRWNSYFNFFVPIFCRHVAQRERKLRGGTGRTSASSATGWEASGTAEHTGRSFCEEVRCTAFVFRQSPWKVGSIIMYNNIHFVTLRHPLCINKILPIYQFIVYMINTVERVF